jgi:hypothetical protein
MAAKKYLRMLSGRVTELAATVQSAGAGNDGDLVALDSAGKIDSSVLPTGVGAETKVVPASEALTAGQWVNFYLDTATEKCRKADATTQGKEADGFVLAGVNSGANATVYLTGINNQLSGLTKGAMYYLHTTAGAGSATAPSGSGNVVQALGKSLSDTEISFHPGTPVTLA